MFPRIAFILGGLRRLGASKSDLLTENLALRQQRAILTVGRPRPRMRAADRFFWLALRRFWPRWKDALVVIRPDTVVCRHREGFRKFWTWKSRRRFIGRPSTKAEIRRLVRRMAAENPTWGAPRIHGELLMLGFDVSERTISRSMPRRPADPEAQQRWRNLLRNHRELLAAMDFFTVPTATFRVLYVFFVIHHARRTVLHVHVTEHPIGGWIIQQLRESFAYDAAPRDLIFDNDKKYGTDVLAVIERMGIRRKQITPYSPWQNGAAERWLQTVRRDLLDHVIVLNERHLHRLLSEFVAYYHDDRTHLALGKRTPSMRTTTSKPNRDAAIVGHPRVGGLHHRYEWRQAAGRSHIPDAPRDPSEWTRVSKRPWSHRFATAHSSDATSFSLVSGGKPAAPRARPPKGVIERPGLSFGERHPFRGLRFVASLRWVWLPERDADTDNSGFG